MWEDAGGWGEGKGGEGRKGGMGAQEWRLENEAGGRMKEAESRKEGEKTSSRAGNDVVLRESYEPLEGTSAYSVVRALYDYQKVIKRILVCT